MTKIDIISGFLGAGKTTLIKKLLADAFPGEKIVLIENEFGDISIDGGFLKESGVQITEMASGCICCTLVGDFSKALREVYDQFHPDRVLIEPSGVGKLSDVIVAVKGVDAPDMELNSYVTVADATKVRVYMKNFGEFYNNQIASAGTIVLSRTQKLTQEKLEAAVALLREKNPDAAIITTPWDELDGKVILSAMEKVSLAEELLAKMRAEHEAEEAEHEAEHHHHHDEDGEEHEHHHHHHDDDEEHEHHHHHHDDEEHEHHHHHDEDGEEHEHHHHHDEDGEEHEHHHHHHDDDEEHEHHHHHHHGGHHHHHADEVFDSWGRETPKVFSRADLESILAALDSEEYGKILRAKGIVNGGDGAWLEFDYVPEEYEVRGGHPDYTGRLCVIGAELDGKKLAALFGL